MNPVSNFLTRPQRRRYSQEERDAITQQARRMRAEGMKMSAIVSELGVSSLSLTKWLKESRPAPAFLPVQVVGAGVTTNTSADMTLVTPSGYRVEGLTPDTLLALLRQLG